MGSGLHSDTAGNRTDAIYFGGDDRDRGYRRTGRWRPSPAPASATPTTTSCWRCARSARRWARIATPPSRATPVRPARHDATPSPNTTGAAITSCRARSGPPPATSPGSACSVSERRRLERPAPAPRRLVRNTSRPRRGPSPRAARRATARASGCSTIRRASRPAPMPPRAIAASSWSSSQPQGRHRPPRRGRDRRGQPVRHRQIHRRRARRAQVKSRRAVVNAADRFDHFAAIDWSGAVGARQRGIAVALCGPSATPRPHSSAPATSGRARRCATGC